MNINTKPINSNTNLSFKEIVDKVNDNILNENNINFSFEENNNLNNDINNDLNNEMNISNISEIKNINNNFEELKINKIEDINKNFETIETTGNGNCLFESLISCMNDDKTFNNF